MVSALDGGHGRGRWCMRVDTGHVQAGRAHHFRNGLREVPGESAKGARARHDGLRQRGVGEAADEFRGDVGLPGPVAAEVVETLDHGTNEKRKV